MEATVKISSMVKQLIHCIAGVFLLSRSIPLSADTYGVVVNGLGGEAKYSESFSNTAAGYADALGTLNNGENHVVLLGESAGRQDILDAIRQQGALIKSGSADVFALMLVGHGTADGISWRFNIKGPDITTEDLVAVMNEIPASRQLLVLASSASGAALKVLSQPSRIVVTATKSGGELNAVRFPGFFAEALQSSHADFDRNEILTVAEAFRFATDRTAEYYEQNKLLASEHARLRGEYADEVAIVLLGSLRQANDDPVVADLLEQRLQLEVSFKALRARKLKMPVASYYDELQTLLIAIALLQQSIDAQTGWSDTDAES